MDKFLKRADELSTVPSDLKAMNKPALIETVKRLKRERDELAAKAGVKTPSPKKAKPVDLRRGSPTPVDPNIFIRLRHKAFRAIKKTTHAVKRGAARTEITERCASKAAVCVAAI